MSIVSTSASAPRLRICTAVSSSCDRVRAATATRRPGAANATRNRAADAAAAASDQDGRHAIRLSSSSGRTRRETSATRTTHAIEEEDAVEMIGFVLDDARRKVVRLHLDPFARAIERPDLDRARPRHAAADVGNAEAPFPVLDHLRLDRR